MEAISADKNIVNVYTTNGNHPRLDATSNKTRISLETANEINERAQNKSNKVIAKSITDQFNNHSIPKSDAPDIIVPKKALSNKAIAFLLISKYKNITNQLDSHKLAIAMSVLNARVNENIRKGGEVSDAIDALTLQYDTFKKDLDNAIISQGIAFDAVSKARIKVTEAQNKVNDYLRQHQFSSVNDALERGSPEADKFINELKSAKQSMAENTSLLKVTTNAALQIREKAQSLLNEINDATAQMNMRYDKVIFSDGKLNAPQQSEHALTRTAIMIRLITEFIMKIDQAASEKLKSDREMNRIQLQSRQAEMQRKSDEYEEQVRKAEEVQKIASCVAKVGAYLATAVGAATSIFGGAGLGLMAVGLAILVADKVTEAITNESLTGMLMEKTVIPLIQMLTNVISEIFDKLGLNALMGEAAAQMFHSILATVVALVAIVALAMVAKSLINIMVQKLTQAFSSAIASTIKTAIQRVIRNVIPNAIRNALKNGASKGAALMKEVSETIMKQLKAVMERLNSVSQSVNNSLLNVLKPENTAVLRNMGQQWMKHLDMLNSFVMMTTTIASGALNITSGSILNSASKALAEFKIAATDIDIIREMMAAIIEYFNKEQNTAQSININLSDALQNINSSSRFIIHNIKV